MTVTKEKTKKGTFLIEFGKGYSNKMEEYLMKNTSPNNKVEEAFNIFKNYHLNHGSTKRELRLDRTFIQLGRRKG